MFVPQKISLYDRNGHRKYLNATERQQFYGCSCKMPIDVGLFARMLYYTGARISEVLNIRIARVDFDSKLVVIESLKKRKKGMFRQVPLPEGYLDELKSFFAAKKQLPHDRIWTYSRRTGSRHIKKIMNDANITGPQACSKGIRHGYALHCVLSNVPLTLISRWLGHASLATTAIYLDFAGVEEREFAERTWYE